MRCFREAKLLCAKFVIRSHVQTNNLAATDLGRLVVQQKLCHGLKNQTSYFAQVTSKTVRNFTETPKKVAVVFADYKALRRMQEFHAQF